MPVFSYRVARPDGSTLDGQMEGEEEHLVRAKLEGQGLLVFRLQRRGATISGLSLGWPAFGKLPLREFLVFNQELLALVKAGLPVLRVWDLLIERANHSGFQQALRTIRQDIRGGASASEALTKHPSHFSELYIATIRAGEQSGNLAEVLQRFISYLKLMIGLRQKVSKALAYPGFLVLVGIAVIGFLLTYVVPTFVSVYAETSKSLPPATQLLLDLVTGGQAYVLPGLVGLVVIGLVSRAYYLTPTGRLVVDRLLLSLPLLGPIFVKHYTVQLTRTLATILAGGTPLVDALFVASGAISNRYVSVGVAGAVEEIREGTTLAAALARPKIFPKLAVEMLSVGEETGSLPTMLHDVAEFYEGDLDLQLTQLTTWIEPMMLLVMGVLVGAIVIVMYLPVFQMAGAV
ncbi:MAG: type II secretion system F family protein [Nitrospiraceae bacterium]